MEADRKARKRDYMRRYFAESSDRREKSHVRQKLYRERNAEQEAERKRLWYLANRARIREAQRLYYQKRTKRGRSD